MKIKNGSDLFNKRHSVNREEFENNDDLVKHTFGQLDEPSDPYYLVFLVVLLCGVAATIPWNATITALDYFDDKFENYNPTFVLPIVVQGPIFLTQMFMLRWGGKASLSLRIVGSFVFMVICMTLILVDSELAAESTGWAVLVTIICVFGVFNGILQLSLYAFTGPLPPSYTSALNQGFGLSGLVICTMRAISLLSLPPTGESGDKNLFYGAILYFALSGSIIVLNIFGVIYALNHPFTQHHLDKVTSNRITPCIGKANESERWSDASKSHLGRVVAGLAWRVEPRTV